MDGPNQYAAPFDVYYLSVVVSVVEKVTNELVPIIKVAVDSQVQNVNVISVREGVLVNLYDPGTGQIVEAESHMAHIEARRSLFARAFTICLLVINWGLASVSAWVTMAVYFRREKPGDAVLLFPLTLAVTIPALRSLYVGSPPYGILIGTPQTLRPQSKD